MTPATVAHSPSRRPALNVLLRLLPMLIAAVLLGLAGTGVFTGEVRPAAPAHAAG